MKKTIIIGLSLFLLQGIVLAQSGLALPADLEGEIPWDLKTLSQAPDFEWLNQSDSVWSLTYTGEEYEGKITKVFAYYASPATFGAENVGSGDFPGIVLVHGGGGTAFQIWVKEWAIRGYAAIAMDLGGDQPLPSEQQDNPWGSKRTRMEAGGPNQDDVHKFYRLSEGFNEQWQYHSVSNIIRAHSLIRSFDEVNPEQTAITGISWGGYLTNLVAGVDQRFVAAVPVYGCGFLQEGSAWDKQFDSLGVTKTNRWVKLWNPSSYVGNASADMLFVNGTNDFAYFVENWQKTANLAKNAQFTLIPEMKHSHLHGAAPEEIYHFISTKLENKSEFISSIKLKEKGDQAKYSISHASKEVYLAYTGDKKRSPDREWKLIPLDKAKGTVSIPSDAKLWYIYWVDDSGNRRSSEVKGWE
ncbi:MAG: prolyl oligopeptidase family serine peptidase [Cytophagales bacterium]|uniref:alpha/beta hydrolase family protein n=1 Tax=Cyclobacterium marinum TaxID=104 RepID=UPI0030D8697B|nr:prolyl oligopeptidase family serine peptidase [Cytophagales bacterium]|tara:strand:- start:94396 stop:95634 length:1239 start_codon:yes stop_codon:yes gene_type:complete